MHDGLFPSRGSNADRALTKSLREEQRLRFVRPLEKSADPVEQTKRAPGTSQSLGMTALAGEDREDTVFGTHRRIEYNAGVPPTGLKMNDFEARLDMQDKLVFGIQAELRDLAAKVNVLGNTIAGMNGAR